MDPYLYNRTPRKKKKKKKNFSPYWLVPVFLVVMLVLAVWASFSGKTAVTTEPPATDPAVTGTEEAPVSEEIPEVTEPHPVATASVGVTGDILIHDPIINNNRTADGNYDFNNIYADIKPYFEKYDFMIANLEVTLGGAEAGVYSGYPRFNCPDSMIDALKNAGVDLLLTANNHSYDTGYNGMLRTVQVLKEKNMSYIGTRETENESFITVQDINGIKIGMSCYTYETETSNPNRKALNGNLLSEAAGPLIQSFSYQRLDAFYAQVQRDLDTMKAQGAEFTMFYLHWGNEYQFVPTSYQKQIAQKLCDMGVDIIVGGHPHVIQPYETLQSKTGHQTLCLYSTGNAISNQRQEIMDSEPTGHTEDGIIFGVTFEKWSDGTVRIADLDFLPTWVERKYVGGKLAYRIIPLDISDPDWSHYNLETLARAQRSYNRTLALVGEGLNAYRAQLGLDPVPLTVS